MGARRFVALAFALLLVLMSVDPVLAAPLSDNGGGVHFGPYTLASGESMIGDLVVFGGPVSVMEDAELDGDLVVFGPFEQESGAQIEGDVVVMGTADVAGTIEGDLFAAGELRLRSTARAEGDVASAGVIDRHEDAVVLGTIGPVSDGDITFPDGPFVFPFVWPQGRVSAASWWIRTAVSMLRGLARVLVLGILALVVMSLWPDQTERMGRVIEENPLTSFGVGLLSLIVGTLVIVLLAITICLSPFAVVGIIAIAVASLLGWISLGLIVGRRVLVGLFDQPSPNPVTAGIVGTALITFLMALARPIGLLHVLLLFILVPPTVGTVILTRFGSRPYPTGGGGAPSRSPAPPPVTPPSGIEPPPPEPHHPVQPPPVPGSAESARGDEGESSG